MVFLRLLKFSQVLVASFHFDLSVTSYIGLFVVAFHAGLFSHYTCI